SNNLESHNDVNSYYIDGISITRGSPRQHVWTLMAGVTGGSGTHTTSHCPCASGSTQGPQSFVGNDYYCESGAGSSYTNILYTSDPLWDGQGCGSLETACCNVPGIPWFHRDYGNTTTTDYLELRVCADQSTIDEDAPVAFYEIYVK
uniref:Fibrinogen C-terminal domain-containing protein n=1 Tax=Amphimedon queenslandica TaxID=400682 RepID=A0A1X7SQY4_AMPQE